MENLIKREEFVDFQIDFGDSDFDTQADFTVYRVISWAVDHSVFETEVYLKGIIKWDGCSHIYFGDNDGYLHLCGKRHFDGMKAVLDAVWDVCSKRIINWDSETVS